MIGYWFSKTDGTTEFQMDPASVGKTHRHDGECIPCVSGLHASPTPWDALGYAPGPKLWEVEIPDDAVAGEGTFGKFSARSRTYVRRVDLTHILRRIAVERALSMIHMWDAPAIMREYLQDEAAGIDRSDIRGSAWDASWSRAWDPVLDAARDAALDAALAAAWGAACATAWDAVVDATRDASMTTAVEAARNRFNELALAALNGG